MSLKIMMTKSVPNKQEQNLSNLAVRTMTALVGGPLALVVAYIGGWLLVGIVAALAVTALLEFYTLGRDRQTPGVALIGVPALLALLAAFEAHQDALLVVLPLLAAVMAFLVETARRTPPALRLYRVIATVAGLIYVGLPSAFLIGVRAFPQGLEWLILVLALTWGTDTLAYAGGRLWGKHLLAPRISPKKTVEGAVIGLIGGFLCGLAWAAASGLLTPLVVPLLVLGPPAAMLGDLFESRIKRFFHAGDSHLAGFNIIPGHGGVLDRIDSLIWVVTLAYLYLRIAGVAS
ncbi:MAG: phosphatidate cytidylyltransferase [Chloroflexi bacterium]|nr:phosphatidate cytidylyltransferase [Chloroflexota bacterium]